MDRPNWWDWDLGFTPHIEARMEERGFTELDLRAMLDVGTKVSPAIMPGRWIVLTRHNRHPWLVVLEPDEADQILWVVTAYQLD